MAAQKRARPAAQAPVSAHPLFPVIVALWFAALLGIGTMVLPQALFDQVGVATGLGALGFTFRLGLGLAAGLVGALIGILLARKVASGQGAARPRKPAKVAERTDANARKPISAMEELGSEGLDEPIEDSDDGFRSPGGSEPLAGRRRPLTVTDESAPSERLTHVPLPGSEGVLDLIGAEDFPRDYSDDDALELGHFDQEEHDIVPDYPHQPQPARPGSPLFGTDPFAEADPVEAPPPPFAPAPSATEGVFRAPQPAADMPAPFQQGAPFTPPSTAPATAQLFGAPVAAEHPEAAPSLFAPQPQAAPAPAAMAAPLAASTQPAPAPSPASFTTPAFSMPVPVPAEPVEAAPPPFAEAPALAAAPASQAIFAQPGLTGASTADDLAGLDTVALVERFTRALRKAGGAGSSALAAAAVQAPAFAMPQPPAPVPAPFVSEPEALFPAASAAPFGASAMPAAAMAPAHPAAAPAAQAAPFGAPSLPAALAPMSFDEPEESDDHNDSFSLPIGDMAKPFASPDAPAVPQSFAQPFAVSQPGADADSDGEPDNEDNFGSLLAMKSTFGAAREFVRIEDDDDVDGLVEPVVVFPGTAPQGGAMPAADGPSRDPAQSAPFTRPQFAPQPAAQPVDRNATEAALRDALARLQQMSGAA